MKRILIYTGAGLLVCLFLLAGGLWIFRNRILNRLTEKKIAQVEQRYGLDVHYESLRFEGTGRLSLGGLSVVPEGRDTLLTLRSAAFDLGFWQLLKGNVEVRNVYMDGLTVSFVKENQTANYDFLFRSRTGGEEAAQDHSHAGYDKRVQLVLDGVFRLLPSDGRLTNLRIRERKDSDSVSLFVPEFNIDHHRFKSRLIFVEGARTQHWQTEGEINADERRVSVGIQAPDLMVPYIRRRLGAEVSFNRLYLSFTQQKENGKLVLSGKTEVDGLAVFHRRLSPERINLDEGELDFHLNVEPHALELDSASTVRFNRLQFHPYLRLEPPAHLIASIHKPSFPAEELFGSLPHGLFENLEGIRVAGNLSYDFGLDADLACPDSLQFHSDLRPEHFRILGYGTTNLSKMSEEFEYTAYEDEMPVRTFPVGPSWNHFLPLDSVPQLMRMAVLQSEDGGFFYHQGFLPDAIRQAMAYDLKARRFARGGSTISMQLVKNVFLNRRKNIARKLEEALIVWLIEQNRLTSKERMFEVYLNIAEWGPRIYGLLEASEFYFGKRPSQLTLEECIYLASIIPKPKHFRSSFDASGRLKENQEGHFRLVARRMAAKGVISEEAAEGIDLSRVVLTGEAGKCFSDSLSLAAPQPAF
ncbi:MAG TPA: transglycosylase domain-containing protein [Bacteroides mediterraneensis]|uniref:transglycosylase domain-containing protein n=1 Tax=Bacteroides mediterraneensis TaxID=1841856 RepID=UPI0026F136C3|nr:transglycosylase domain-containing protein [Bacteroides mediterraneensis]HJH64002.1 transglycosylase domain-containing protein [Bacteroides mediterraneensis]